MIAAAALAVILLGVLLFRGDAGRVGILVAFACGSVLSGAAMLWGLGYDLLGVVVQVASSVAGIG